MKRERERKEDEIRICVKSLLNLVESCDESWDAQIRKSDRNN